MITNSYGKVELNNNVFKDVALISLEKVKGVYPVKNDSSFCTVSYKDDKLKLLLKIKIDIGTDVVKVCNKLTESVHESIESMTGIDCKEINIDVQGFVKKEEKK